MIKLQYRQGQASTGGVQLTELRLLQAKLPETAHIPALLWLSHVLILTHFSLKFHRLFLWVSSLQKHVPNIPIPPTHLLNNEAVSTLTTEPEGLGTGSEHRNY